MKRILSMLIVFLLIGSLSAAAFAHEIPDLSQNGTITFTMDWNSEPLDTGSLSMYQVGIIVEDDGNYSFAPIEALQIYDLSLENLDSYLASELAKLAKKEKLPEITTPIEDGEAFFDDVAPGLYVVLQDESDASEGFSAISPFLISIPQYKNGRYELNVIADPKVPLKTAPTEPKEPEPTKPADSKLPQTGQLNWPVPLLTVSGLALFAAGWFLLFGGKKECYKK